MRVVGRILAVAFALAAALLTGAIVLVAVGGRFAAQNMVAQAPEIGEPEIRGLTDLIAPFMFGMETLPALSILPAVIVVALGEAAQIRSLLYYLVAGGLAAALMPLLSGQTPSLRFVAILATAGFAGGLAYWMLAGRNALTRHKDQT